jgi:hypothetical protein
VFVLALLLRLALIGARYDNGLSHFQSGDYTLYRIGAEHIRDEGDFSNSLFLLRTPLFPLVVTLLGVDDLAVLIVNTLIGAGLAPLSVVLARQLGLTLKGAALAGVIVAVDPASITYSAWLGPEPLANVCLLIMLIALLHGVIDTPERAPWWGAAAGLAMGLSVLARPTPFLIWIGLAAWLLIRYRRRWVTIMVYALVSAAGIGGWIVHNGVVFDNPTVSSVGTYSLLYYRAASVEHWGSGDYMDTVYTRLSRQVEERLGRDTSQVDTNTRHTHYTGPYRHTAAMQAVALDTFRRYPLAYLMTIPIGVGRMYGFTNLLPRAALLIELPWNLLLGLGTLAGLWIAYRQKRGLLLWACLLVGGYYNVATLLAQTSGMDTRMRSMLTPLMAILCVVALSAWRERSPRKADITGE